MIWRNKAAEAHRADKLELNQTTYISTEDGSHGRPEADTLVTMEMSVFVA